MPGRHRQAGAEGRRSYRAPATVLGLVALVTLTAIALQTVAADARGCGTDGVPLRVMADPAIAPVLREIADDWAESEPDVDGRCVTVDVKATAAADVASGLGTRAGGPIDVAADPAPTPAEADLPDVWVPDSTLWLTRVRAVDRDAFDLDAPSLASSPVVLGVREAELAALSRAGPMDLGRVRDLIVGGQLRLGLAEPRRDTASLVGALVVQQAVAPSRTEVESLVGLFRAMDRQAVDSTGVLARIGEAFNAAPLSEQSVARHNASGPVTTVAAVPLDGAPTLDFPYATVTGNPPAVRRAASLFRDELLSGDHSDVLARFALRSPDGAAGPGFPTGHGVTNRIGPVLPLGPEIPVDGIIRIWTSATTASRVLALVDVTSSMTGAKLALLREASVRGLRLFANDSLLGMWAYSAAPRGAPAGTRDYQQVVPMSRLDAAQRGRVETALAGARTAGTNDCALFESVLAAYRAMKRDFDPRLSNTIVVFTDGRSDKPGGLDLRQFQRQLESEADTTKEIRVILLGIGPQADMAQLAAIARTAGGAAYPVQDPAQIAEIFLQALLT